jgi:hypothetical protein
VTDIKKALATLTRLNMNVKHVRSDLTGIYLTPLDTHYIMQNNNIVHVGNQKTVVEFALRQAE